MARGNNFSNGEDDRIAGQAKEKRRGGRATYPIYAVECFSVSENGISKGNVGIGIGPDRRSDNG